MGVGDITPAINVPTDAGTATTSATSTSKDTDGHNNDVLGSQCSQQVCQTKRYSTQNRGNTKSCTGTLPCAAEGGTGVGKPVVTNTQEYESRIPAHSGASGGWEERTKLK